MDENRDRDHEQGGVYTADAMRLKHSLSPSREGQKVNVMTPVSEGNSDVTGSVFLALAFFSSLSSAILGTLLRGHEHFKFSLKHTTYKQLARET